MPTLRRQGLFDLLPVRFGWLDRVQRLSPGLAGAWGRRMAKRARNAGDQRRPILPDEPELK